MGVAPSAGSRSANVAGVVRDASWLPHRYDPGHDAIHFLRVDRALHGRATFLTDAYLPSGAEKLVLRRDECVEAARAGAAPLHFVFHSAYCCSTLLARAFDVPGLAMGLKEPQILNDVVGWRQRGGRGPQVASVLDTALDLLAQPFTPGEAVIVKPSNVLNPLAAQIMATRAGSKALLLHAPLPVYLASIARKGMWGAVWVREHFVGALKEGIVDLGFGQEDLFRQTDLQIAASGWLAQQALFARLVAQFGPDRVRTLNSEALLRDKSESVLALARHFGLRLDRPQAEAISAGPAFTRHSKTAADFGSDDRAREQQALTDAQREELEKVMVWAAAVAEKVGISMRLVDPLLS